MLIRSWWPVVALVAVGSTSLFSERIGPSWNLELQPLASPAQGESSVPQFTTSTRGVLLSWVERKGALASLRFAERTTSGWSEARTAASGDNWFVNWADVPSVLRLEDGTLVAQWLQKSGSGTYAYDVRLSYSKDDGRTWAPSFSPHNDGTQTEHGFVSLVQMPGAGLGLIWLDGRAMGSMKGGHEGHGSGAMSLRFAQYGPDWKQTNDVPVDLRVCECCPTAAAVTSEGVVAAFRNRSEDEVRDIFVSRLEAGRWTEPLAAVNDGWKIPGCPVNGPALSARGRNVALAWFTTKDEVPQAYAAFSSDAGRSFGAPIRLDDGVSMGRVDIEWLDDGSAAALYIEQLDKRTQVRVRRITPSGEKSNALVVAEIEGSRASGYPRLAARGNEIVFAWTARDGTTRVMTSTARIPGK
jgi:hypothetical protein